jgi:ABC-type bacteriocin/lantibiotic exporter with double-glycine peptidase domain
LDSQIEEEILTYVDQLAENLIIINVSHRKSVLRHSDRSILLKNGEALECNTDKVYNENLGKVKF